MGYTFISIPVLGALLLISIDSSRCEWLLRALIALRGLWISALELSIGIFDPHVFFEQATEFERAKK
jgi:hypothetical protein